MNSTTHCTDCGNRPSAERPAFTWSLAIESGSRSWTCAPCSRTQLTEIEHGTLVPA